MIADTGVGEGVTPKICHSNSFSRFGLRMPLRLPAPLLCPGPERCLVAHGHRPWQWTRLQVGRQLPGLGAAQTRACWLATLHTMRMAQAASAVSRTPYVAFATTEGPYSHARCTLEERSKSFRGRDLQREHGLMARRVPLQVASVGPNARSTPDLGRSCFFGLAASRSQLPRFTR